MRLPLLLLPGALLALLLSASSCGSPQSPEARLRGLIEEAEAAAEGRELRRLKPLVAESYRDERGNDREALIAMLRYHFLRNEEIHLLLRVRQISFPAAGEARATVLVAMAGEAIPSAEELRHLRADLLSAELRFIESDGGDWLLAWSSWRSARSDDFF